MGQRRRRPPEVEDDIRGPGAEHEGGPVAVRRTHDGRAFFQPADALNPRALERLDGDQQHVLAAIQTNAMQIRMATEDLDQHVALAREMGVSWHLIGWSVGTTGEAARQRWGLSRD
jgi:hypothetical protein